MEYLYSIISKKARGWRNINTTDTATSTSASTSWGSKAEEDDYFGTSSLYTPSGDYWIGLREDEGWGYEWVDGTTTDYTNWMDENPNSQVSCDWWSAGQGADP